MLAWILFAIACVIIWWSWGIIFSMADEITKNRKHAKVLTRMHQQTKYELDALKQSIINTGFTNQHMPVEQMSAKLINKLIQFCHPDKHNNDPKAGMLTAELIKIKNSRGF